MVCDWLLGEVFRNILLAAGEAWLETFREQQPAAETSLMFPPPLHQRLFTVELTWGVFME